MEESEGDHISELMLQGRAAVGVQFQQFLQRFWTLSRQNPGIDFIREIDGLITRIFRPEEAKVGNDQVEPLAMLNVDCKGDVGTFSPELLGYRNERYHDFLVGNVHTHTLEQMLHSPAMKAMVDDIQAGVEACRQECGYFSLCGGGAPVNKLSENGTLRQHTDLVLQPGADHARKPDPLGLRPDGALACCQHAGRTAGPYLRVRHKNDNGRTNTTTRRNHAHQS